MFQPLRVVLLLLAGVLLAGCGDEQVDRVRGEVERRARAEVQEIRRDVEDRVTQTRADFEERRRRFGERIEEVLASLDRVFVAPDRTLPTVRSRGRNEPQTVDAFLTDLLESVDRYWERTFAEAGLPRPSVRYRWIEPGGFALSACGPLNDRSAAYCPANDTVYVGQQFASDLYRGVLEGLPGEAGGDVRAVGDFAVAYVVAHEYAHNLQQELGIFDSRVSETAKPFELQADCLAGTWAYSVFAAGDLEPGDLEEATNTAQAVGDFEVGAAQHHGTPDERREALLRGFRSGDPSVCDRYLPS